VTASEIAFRLKGKEAASGYVACCPAHEDRDPSLSIKQTPSGKILVHCFAGCTQEAVVDALRALELWPEAPRKEERTIVAEYPYTDEHGNLLYQVVRTDPKGFFQRYLNSSGRWVNKKGSRQVLYHFREVLESPIVFVAEGEKDVETLRDHGFVATTNAGGANAPWVPEFTDTLRGREAILIPDNDSPGWERVTRIARNLIGTAARIRVLDLPKDTKDVTEWFQRGHSELELIAKLEGVHAV
jgi:putative DNA primase/helicase